MDNVVVFAILVDNSVVADDTGLLLFFDSLDAAEAFYAETDELHLEENVSIATLSLAFAGVVKSCSKPTFNVPTDKKLLS